MKYEDLRNFILYDMKPNKSSGEPKNYQPVMILLLNQNHGKATKKEIMDALKKANPNRRVTDGSFNIVCKTLRGHKVVERKGDQYFLLDYKTIDKFFGRKAEITKCCYNKIQGSAFAASPRETISDPKMKNNSFWLSSGSWKNWEHTINNPPIRWGAKEKERNLWEKLQVNDVVFCSASSKTNRPFTKNGIFMVAKVIRKYALEKNDGYYPGSLIDDKDFFKYRFELEPLKIVKNDEMLLPVVKGLAFRKSLNRITNTSTIRQLTENLDKLWNVKIESDDGIEELIRKFDQNRKLFRSWWKTDEEKEQELYEFTSRFPIDKILDMKIEDYVFGIPDPETGKSKEHTFCYMLEHFLPSFGGISGTPNQKFGIYFNKTKKDYSYEDDRYDSPQAAFEAIKNDIHRILQAGKQFQRDGNWKKLSDIVDHDEGHNIQSHIRSKILVAYFPNECVGIHSRYSLSRILEKLGTPSKDLFSKITLMQSEILKIKNSHPIMRKWSNADYGSFLWSAIEKAKDLDDEETEGKKVEGLNSAQWSIDMERIIDEILKIDTEDELALSRDLVKRILIHLKSGKHVVLVGPPGVGKTDLARRILRLVGKKIVGKEDYVESVASAEWSRFEVIGGIDLNNEFQKGIVTKAVLENKWLLIDEFNRADMNKAFGEMFLAIEYKTIQLRPQESKALAQDSITINPNFRMICTMNDFDKNLLLTELSYGLITRFAFVSVVPQVDREQIAVKNRIERELKLDNFSSEYDNCSKQIETFFKFINEVRKKRNIGVRTSLDLVKYLLTSVSGATDENFKWSCLNEGLCDYLLPQFDRLDRETIEFVLETSKKYLPKDGDNFKPFMTELERSLENLRRMTSWMDIKKEHES